MSVSARLPVPVSYSYVCVYVYTNVYDFMSYGCVNVYTYMPMFRPEFIYVYFYILKLSLKNES